MEKQFQVVTNGTSVVTDDFQILGETAGLADDRVLAELFRLTPNTGSVARGIIRYSGTSANQTSTVCVTGSADGKVRINPFRAVLGSRTAEGTSALKSWRDIRSNVVVGTATTLKQDISITANASGNPRWDLIYCAITPDSNAATVLRKVKDSATLAITTTSVVNTLVTTTSIIILAGTPGASPALPTIPADSAGTYYIPLAYVHVANGWGASSTLLNTDILPAAPLLHFATGATGAVITRAASSQYKPNGGALTTARIATWGSSGTKPEYFIAPDTLGSHRLVIALDLLSATSANWSHSSGGIVDDTRNWQKSIFETRVYCESNAGSSFAWKPGGATTTTMIPRPGITAASATMHAAGQSFSDDLTAITGSGSGGVVMLAADTNMSAMATSTKIALYVDYADSGKLKLWVSGLPACKFFLVLDATTFAGF